MKKAIIAQTSQFNNPNRIKAEKTDRNAELFKDFKNGVELFDLCAKYRITSTRIYAIIHKMQDKEASKNER